MPKDSISKTAQVNLQMLASLGVPEAVQFARALNLEGDPLGALSHLPFARRIPLCVSCISEVLYQSANSLIYEAGNTTVLDIACGYSPRVLLLAPEGYTYIGADLPDVTSDLNARRSKILPHDATWLAGYRTVDATDRTQMERVVGALREPITIVTQGLLSYLTLEEKGYLAESIRSLLERDGGCWIIPDADPGTLLFDTFRAVLGQRATNLVKGIYRILDRRVGRDRKEMGWQSADEIASALQELGFTARRVPLLHEGMKLRCMDRVSKDAAARLRECWSDKSSLVVQAATVA